MLTKEEKKEYVLKHKKDFQKVANDYTKASNKFLKDSAQIIYDTDLYLYKKQKEEHPELKIKKPKKQKNKYFKCTKLSDRALRSIYMMPHVANQEKVCGIDLKPYLKKIRNRKLEYEIVLHIKNNKIIKESIYTSNETTRVSVYKNDREVIKYAKRYKTNVYFVHNHPLNISARPSSMDIRMFEKRIVEFKEEGVKVLDCGVVTFDDYYSYMQEIKKVNRIMKEVKKRGVDNEFVLDLIKATLTNKERRILYRKRSLHPNNVYDSDKMKRVKNLSHKKYKQLQKQARKEVDKIIKEHPEYAF